MVRLICVSDTHSLHRQIRVPDGDVLIHAGDLTRHGTLDELREVNDWLGELPHPQKIVIAGNHDRCCEDLAARVPQLLHHARYLCDTGITYAGYTFFGAPWTPGNGGCAFSRSLTTLAYRWAQIPTGLDVLITHGPPLGGRDQNARGEHLGCLMLAEAVLRVQPRLHIFGHIHESYGVTATPVTTFVNASSCTNTYVPANTPLVIDVP